MANKSIDNRKPRKIVSITWLANYCNVHRHTMTKWLKEEKVNLWDLHSILDFILKNSNHINYKKNNDWYLHSYNGSIELVKRNKE